MKLLMQRRRHKSSIHLLTLPAPPIATKMTHFIVTGGRVGQHKHAEWMLQPTNCLCQRRLLCPLNSTFCFRLKCSETSNQRNDTQRVEKKKYRSEAGRCHCVPELYRHKKPFLFLVTVILIYSPVSVCFPSGRGRGDHY